MTPATKTTADDSSKTDTKKDDDKKVARWIPPEDKLRIGDIVIDEDKVPDFPNKKAGINSANEWSAYAEQEIAQGLVNMGVPKDEATRRAASAVVGMAAGGATGFAVGFTPTAIVAGPVSIVIGLAQASGVFGPVPAMLAPAAPVIGAGISVGAGVLTGVPGAVIGGVLGTALGGGDLDSQLTRPDGTPWAPKHRKDKDEKSAPADTDTTGGQVTETATDTTSSGQFSVRTVPVNPTQPALDYTVSDAGDVSASVTVAGREVKVGWTAEQAKAPLDPIKTVIPDVEQRINKGVQDLSRQAEKIIPGLQVSWNAPVPKASGDSGATQSSKQGNNSSPTKRTTRTAKK
ncbi:hypothetical protein [Gordonia pseudamarae]|uniref:hypothetical protein n=1 Tax=Gordonia pseudamarae TaxID=2831662 RepID=UPI001BD14673|nr:hypothetical protein [Gordonia pseudamarae]